MRPIPLRGVVLDVDGTLLTSTHAVSPRMRQVCKDLVGAGLWLTIASARPPRSVLQIAAETGATGPLCALNGAIVLARDGSILTRSTLPQDLVAELIARFVDDRRVSLNLYSGPDWFVLKSDRRVRDEARIVGFEPVVRPTLGGIEAVEKILLIAEHDVGDSLGEILQRDTGSAVISLSKPGYVEITPCGVDKKFGVEAAADHAGISLGELIACGDGENDIALLAACGYGIAMAHAPAGLRAVAQEVVGSNDDDTLPAALASLLLPTSAAKAAYNGLKCEDDL